MVVSFTLLTVNLQKAKLAASAVNALLLFNQLKPVVLKFCYSTEIFDAEPNVGYWTLYAHRKESGEFGNNISRLGVGASSLHHHSVVLYLLEPTCRRQA